MEGTLYLEMSSRLCMDPTELMEKHTGRLIWSADDGDYVLGKTRWWVIRVNEMIDKELSPCHMLDGEDADTAAFCELFLEDEMEWPREVRRVCPEAIFGDLAILDRLIVNPPFRGKKVGLHCMEMTMRITGGMGLFALYPMPLQHHPHYAKEVAMRKTTKRSDLKKLIAYYEQAGFRKVPRSKFMVLDPRTLNPIIQWDDGEGDIAFERTEAMEAFRLAKRTEEEDFA
jgi:hypothetical protein